MKTVVITGATSGIGFAIAKTLYLQGYSILGIGRDEARCKEAQARLEALGSFGRIQYFTADLSQLYQTERLAQSLLQTLALQYENALDALILNAGGVTSWHTTSAEGYEYQFTLNYLSGVLLLYRLLPLLSKRQGRVLWTGSGSHKHTRIKWQDIMLRHHYNCLFAYKQSKLCAMLFAGECNRRLRHTGVQSYVVDPGLVHTDIGAKQTSGMVSRFWKLRSRYGTQPEIPAQTYAYLLNERPAPQALYFAALQPRWYARQAKNAEDAAKLFALSEKLCGISFMEVGK